MKPLLQKRCDLLRHAHPQASQQIDTNAQHCQRSRDSASGYVRSPRSQLVSRSDIFTHYGFEN
jgi:hypothetical protein